MKIENLDELDKLIALCRKRGISNIEIDGIKFELGSAPPSNYKRRQNNPGPEEELNQLGVRPEPHDFLETLLWSSNSHPQVGVVNE